MCFEEAMKRVKESVQPVNAETEVFIAPTFQEPLDIGAEDL
jgi:hypothetical protein